MLLLKHISNILKVKELENSVCANFAHTGSDGKSYHTKYFKLVVITPETLTALALLIAESAPLQKEIIIKLVVNLLV